MPETLGPADADTDTDTGKSTEVDDKRFGAECSVNQLLCHE